MPGREPLGPNAAAEMVVQAVAERKVICLKGFIVKSSSRDIIKFIPNLEDPLRYYLIPRKDVYYNLDIDILPFGKGYMIWANSENIRLVEAAKPLFQVSLGVLKPKKDLEASDLICPNCQYMNNPSALICEKCGLVFNTIFQK